MTGIQFYSERIHFTLRNRRKLTAWLTKVAQTHGSQIADLSYVFCSDRFLLKLNKRYLKHQTLTDIITFDFSEGNGIEGEIYISIPRIRENARKFEVPFETELRRVLAHGLLHLLGFNDKSPREKAQMRQEEEACLSLWN